MSLLPRKKTLEQALGRVQVVTLDENTGSMYAIFATPVGKSESQAQQHLLIVAEWHLRRQLLMRRVPDRLLYPLRVFNFDRGSLTLGVVYRQV